MLGGWGQLRAVLGPEMFNLWKPLVPAGLEGTWAPVREAGRIAWYFNGDYPWLGMLFCAPIIVISFILPAAWLLITGGLLSAIGSVAVQDRLRADGIEKAPLELPPSEPYWDGVS